MLRTNVKFALIDSMLKSLLVTNAEPSEGKRSVAVNLAVVFFQSGIKIFLMDCDLRLRRPAVQNQFELSNQVGPTPLIFLNR